MECFVKGILMIEGIIFLAILIVLIYLIVRRIEDKGKETFEKRDN